MPPPNGATNEEGASKARLRLSQLESGADYLVICQVIKDDPKLLQVVSRELIAQGALTQVNGCLEIADNSGVATAKQKPAVKDDKQLHRNFKQKVGDVKKHTRNGDVFVKEIWPRVVCHAICGFLLIGSWTATTRSAPWCAG